MADKKILVADDEPDMLMLITARLEASGYEAITAIDGQDALNKIRETKPALILLDVMMPRLNGYQVCREVRKDPDLKDIPVIMLSAKSQESDKFWGKETGADDYITKPFEASELLAKIKARIGDPA